MEELDRIHHIAINVSDIEAACHWYTSSFSCEILLKQPTQAILQFENIRLVLVMPSQQRTHVAYTKSNAASFGELRTQADGILSTFVADPTGNPVEIVLPEEGNE